MIRRTLGLTLATEKNDMKVSFSDGTEDGKLDGKGNGKSGGGMSEPEEVMQLRDKNECLRALLSVMSF
jgi:hypothetical protein